MLTNLFYYDFYKPYIFKNEKITTKHPATYQKAENKRGLNKSENSEEQKNIENDFSFFLNKTFKSEIINYAETISLKNSVKNIINKTANFQFNSNSKKEILSKELSDFKEKFNSYQEFSKKNYRHSPLLSEFSDSLNFRVENHERTLEKFGITFDEETSFLNFDKEFFDKLPLKSISENLLDLYAFSNEVYNDTCEIMTIPMENHMNFKNLDYYYNYIFANEKHNTVKIIESGMLVDICL